MSLRTKMRGRKTRKTGKRREERSDWKFTSYTMVMYMYMNSVQCLV